MEQLEKFGKIIAEDLRDCSLNTYLDIESGFAKAPDLVKLNLLLSKFTEEQKVIVKKLLTVAVDAGIHDFLYAIDSEKENMEVNIGGKNIAKLSDGLQGEIFTEDGWFAKYSQHGENGI